MRKEWKQFFAQPQYWSFFIIAELLMIVATYRILDSWQNIPSMIFFTMAFNLLFTLYGAEQARQETKHNISELISSLPRGRMFYLTKFFYWVSHVFLWYVVFLISVLVYLTFHEPSGLSSVIVVIIVKYTLMNWFVPFLVSLVLGYSIYMLWPSIASYIVLVAIWILLGPYNHFVKIVPADIVPWLATSDTNFLITQYMYVTEHMIINNGMYWQRTLAICIAVFFFTLAVPLIRKQRMVQAVQVVLVASIVFVPFLAPSQNISDPSRAMILEPNPFGGAAYTIESYQMVFHHLKEDHRFAYEANLRISPKSNQITVALWNTIELEQARWNENPIEFRRTGNWVNFSLPSGSLKDGILHLKAKSNRFPDVGPSSFELISTSPWYPMNPEEAIDPVGKATKEHYEIQVDTSGFTKILTNLTKSNNNRLTGDAYGPTILKANYAQYNDSVVKLINYSDREVE